MFAFIRPVAAAALLAGLTIIESSHGALSRGQASVTRLPPDTNIAEQVARNEGSVGDVTYKIEGLHVTGAGNQRGPEIKLDLHEVSALDEDTTYSVNNGESKPVGRRGHHILVSDAEKSDTFVVLSVDVESGTTSGIIQGSQGKPVKLSQGRGMSVAAREAEDFTPPAWECGADKIIHSEGDDEDADNTERRRLLGREHNHDHDHDHHHHDDDKLTEGFEAIKNGLRGGKVNVGRALYLTDAYPQRYTYQVDMFIEIDQAFVDKQGSLEAAFDYVDVLVSGANIIYEHEIDTHLHVAHIALTNHYDGAGSTSGALDMMMGIYRGGSWHYNAGSGMDLHHALLGNPLGGGIAYRGVLCNSWYGYGLSASLKGNFVSLDAATLWDMKVFAHELGHNFGSAHTHDSSQYSPVVDTCGTNCPGDIAAGSATLMSYCHMCSGSYSNILYTFGGDWQGSDRSDVNNWQNNVELVGSVSTEPRRVPKLMYEHVTGSGSCLNPTHAVPLQVCSIDAQCDDEHFCNGQETCDTLSNQCVPGPKPVCFDGNACTYDLCIGSGCSHPPVNCDDGNSCTIDTCDTIEGCKHELLDDCCGNGICEAGEDTINCQADCGPFTIDTPLCSSCYINDGNMFDVEALVDIEINSLTFFTYQGSGTVEVWTRPGPYSGHQYSDAGWTKVATKTFSGDSWAMVETPTFSPKVLMSAGSLQAFYVTHTGTGYLLYTSGIAVGSVVADDDRMKILAGRSASYQFGGGSTGNAWGGSFSYEFGAAQCTADEDCGDEIFCNGVEACQSGTCVSGTAPTCANGCNEATDSCNECSEDDDCDDGQFCNGVETCSSGTCADGAAPTCPHGCDESADSCFECAVNANCDDGIFCNGVEACQSGTCVAGVTVDCDDSVSCTVDSCNEGTDSCDNIANHARCDNGLFCDGVETCDPVLDCQSGTNPTCTNGCDESTDSCFDCSDHLECDNGIFCDGEELCSSGRCVSGTAPTCAHDCNEATDSCNECSEDDNCDDGSFCNGVETCSSGTCAEGAAPTCPHGCDESADSCFECAVNADCDNGIFCDGQEACVDNVCVTGDAVDCDDGVSCTVDSCNEGTDSCDNIADHARCDNGFFCDGVETCDAVLDCQSGTNHTCTHACDESTDSCFDCSDNWDCDNGIFCDGTELCSSGRCESGTAPTCANGCNEATNSCNEECSQDVDCDDGNYCNGVETCSSGTCADGAAPTCPHGCDEVSDSCFECAANADCDNGIFCDGQEACVNNVCADGAAPTCPHGCDESADSCFECDVNSDCDNGIFCDGQEACVNNVCVTGSVVDCDDNVACTVDSCNEVAESCEHTPNNAACDNGFFCDGDETCDAVLGCQIGMPVSCNDGVGCTDDSCSESTGQCEFVPNNANCNSGEVCDGQACVVTTGWTTILSNDFESGWQNFNDGGSDAARRSDGTNWVHSGLSALRIRDGRDSSAVVETDTLDTSNYEDVKVSFWFRPRGVENGEAFSLQTSACDGNWDTVTTWTRASEWSSNGRWYGVGDGADFTAVEFPTMGDCTAIRFRCEGNQNNDRVYIDDVLVEAN